MLTRFQPEECKEAAERHFDRDMCRPRFPAANSKSETSVLGHRSASPLEHTREAWRGKLMPSPEHLAVEQVLALVYIARELSEPDHASEVLFQMFDLFNLSRPLPWLKSPGQAF
jgi:hypothetical protein